MKCIKVLAGIAMQKRAPPSARVNAAIALLDRGWGKPAQAHTGEDGEGSIKVTIRTIIEGVPARVPQPLKAIEAMPIESNGKSHDE